jgi:hypothetical protein
MKVENRYGHYQDHVDARRQRRQGAAVDSVVDEHVHHRIGSIEAHGRCSLPREKQYLLHHFALLTCEEQAKIDGDKDIAGEGRGGLNGGDGLVENN